MSYYKYVKPAKSGLIVRDPGTKAILPENGMNVPWTGKVGRYWRRRMRFGDIVEVRAPEPKTPRTTVSPKKKPEPEEKNGPVSSIERGGFQKLSDPGPIPEEKEKIEE